MLLWMRNQTALSVPQRKRKEESKKKQTKWRLDNLLSTITRELTILPFLLNCLEARMHSINEKRQIKIFNPINDLYQLLTKRHSVFFSN